MKQLTKYCLIRIIPAILILPLLIPMVSNYQEIKMLAAVYILAIVYFGGNIYTYYIATNLVLKNCKKKRRMSKVRLCYVLVYGFCLRIVYYLPLNLKLGQILGDSKNIFFLLFLQSIIVFVHLLVNIFLVNAYIYTGQLNFIFHRSLMKKIRCEENYQNIKKIGIMAYGSFLLLIIILFFCTMIFRYSGNTSVIWLWYLWYLGRLVFKICCDGYILLIGDDLYKNIEIKHGKEFYEQDKK